MRFPKIIYLLLLLIFVASAVPVPVSAQGDFTFNRVVNIAYGLVQWLFTISFAIATILMIWFGIQIMIGGGISNIGEGANATKVNTAKKAISWVIIGFAVVMVANVIVLSLRRAITGGGEIPTQTNESRQQQLLESQPGVRDPREAPDIPSNDPHGEQLLEVNTGVGQ